MIKIKKNPNGDTRTAKKDVSLEEFRKANLMHKSDVENTMDMIAQFIHEKGKNHDISKMTLEEMFYSDFLSTMNNSMNFVEGDWYKIHVNSERHHLLSRCPSDVNLFDVIEMIVDCTCAGLSRSGEVRGLEINEDILKLATDNTVDFIKSRIEVI